MRRDFIAQSVKTSPKYLTIRVRVDMGATVRWAYVKVPWRLMNEQYEEISDHMGREANEQAKQAWEPAYLPLEKWE